MSDESHYDILGVAPGAPKGALREAYRARLDAAAGDGDTAARIRRAWQVLSDPVQRDRYDAEIGVGLGREPRVADAPASDHDTVTADEIEVLDADEEHDEPPRRGGRGQRPTRDGRPPIQRPPSIFSAEPLPVPDGWPRGFKAPPPKARAMAMAVDALVLLVLFLASQVIGAAVIDQMYPTQTDRIDVLDRRIDRFEARADALDTRLDSAESRLERARDNDNNAARAEANAQIREIEADRRRNDRQLDRVEDKRRDLLGELQGGQLLVTLTLFAVMMLYLGLPSRRTGQTLGKRLFQIRVVRIDGTAITWREIVRRYGIPLLVALTLVPFLGPVAFALLLFVILRWPRHPNYQGLHDRFAGTIVVDG